MTSELSDSDFLFNYQTNKFKDSSKDPFTSVIYKRRCMILSLAHSSKSLNNATSCHIFEDQLEEYFGLIDNRKGVNNYAKATLDLLSNVKNVGKSWKSGLPDTVPELSKLLKPLKGECLNPTDDGVCGNVFPPSSLIPQLLAPAQLPHNEKPKPPTSVTQTTLDGFRRSTTNVEQLRGGEKRSLYSSYQDFQKVENKNNIPREDSLPKNNFIDKNNKRSLYSSYGETTNPKPKQITEFQVKQRGKFDWKNSRKNFNYNDSDMNQDEPIEKSEPYHKFPGRKGYTRNSKPIFTRGEFQSNSGNENEEEPQRMDFETHFKTAAKELQISNQKKFGNQKGGRADYDRGYGGGSGSCERASGFQPHAAVKKFLGGKRSVSSKFIPPVRNNSQEEEYKPKENVDPESELDERLKNIEPRMVELIQNEIMDCGSKIGWDDIAGLEFAKSTIQEIVVWPMLRPDIFTGLRRPPKGILLFGPPGTGKTLIGKCIASQSNSTFFSISASSLTSKWIGDGEKMVRALFAVARVHQPAVVFIDEIDSLLSQRSDTEHESSRRIKTEFLVQLDGAATGEEDRILVIGATNRPQELDEAARRRLVKRLYIPLPDKEARKQLTQNLVKLERNDLTSEDIEEISCLTEGYSGADMKNLCQEASLGPIRSISSKDMFQISPDQVRPVNISDFKMALRRVKSSVSSKDLEIYLQWDQQYGSGAFSS